MKPTKRFTKTKTPRFIPLPKKDDPTINITLRFYCNYPLFGWLVAKLFSK